LDWNILVAFVVDTVLAIRWQDNNFVLGLSTIHIVHEASSSVTALQKCPPNTSTNAAIVCRAFGGLAQKELEIPCFINDYNHHMNSVDLANQFRQAYNTQQIAYRTWIPLLHWVLDQAAINAYKIGLVGKTWTKSHLEFRRVLYRKLLAYSKHVKPQLWKEAGPHKWEARNTRTSCAWCLKVHRFKKKLLAQQEEAGIEAVKEISSVTTPTQCRAGCNHCNVPLCKSSNCWTNWHSQKG
jgi:hypothetical protein